MSVAFRGTLLSTGTGAPGVGGYPSGVCAPTLDVSGGVGYATLSAQVRPAEASCVPATLSRACVLQALLHDTTLRPVGKWTRLVSAVDPEPPAKGASAAAALPRLLARCGGHGVVAPLTASGDGAGGLPPRDLLADGSPQFALLLRYKVALGAAASDIHLSLGRAHGVLYESHLDAQARAQRVGRAWHACPGLPALHMSLSLPPSHLPSHHQLVVVLDEHGRVVAASDAKMDAVSLPAGPLTVLVQARRVR